MAVYLRSYQLLPHARTSELFADLFEHRRTPGTLATTQQNCAADLEEFETVMQMAARAHFDETGLAVAGRRHWLHVARTPHYATHAKRGTAATDDIGILPHFHGIAVRPVLAGGLRACLVQCASFARTDGAVEQRDQPWAQAMKDLLCAIKRTVETAQAAGAEGLDATAHEAFVTRYHTILTEGLAHNPAVAAVPGQRGRSKQSKARNRLLRLPQREAEGLRFMMDFRIPFDNNRAERDLRLMKVQQKIAGCCRAVAGAAAFCRLRSYMSTVRKHGLNILAALEQVFQGTPFLPEVRAG